MTVQEAINQTNELKSNAFDEDRLTAWLTECENYCIDSILNKAEGIDMEHVAYDYGDDDDLLIPDPYSEIYVHYLTAKIDYINQEDTYNNSVAMYNAALTNFAAHFRRENRPKMRPRVHTKIH